jgi:thymidine kinase
MAELVFFTGTMDCGKSTRAIQPDYNQRQRGLSGMILPAMTGRGRRRCSAGCVQFPAVEVVADLDIWTLVVTG